MSTYCKDCKYYKITVTNPECKKTVRLDGVTGRAIYQDCAKVRYTDCSIGKWFEPKPTFMQELKRRWKWWTT